MLPSDYSCPRCKCQACYALHRKGFDWVMSMIGLRPARCLTCGKRFYARYAMATDQTSSAPQERSDEGRVGEMSNGGGKKSRDVYSRKSSSKAA